MKHPRGPLTGNISTVSSDQIDDVVRAQGTGDRFDINRFLIVNLAVNMLNHVALSTCLIMFQVNVLMVEVLLHQCLEVFDQ